MRDKASDSPKLPEANEFSPGQVELRRVLEIVAEQEGNKDLLIEGIRREYFSTSAERQPDKQKRLEQQKTRAYNVLVGMKGYGLFDLTTSSLTDVGRRLLTIQDETQLHEALAEHILMRRHGIGVLEAVRSLRTRREKITKASLAAELGRRGFRLPRATTHHTKLRQWLGKAGVIDEGYIINEAQLAKLVGTGMDGVEQLAALTAEQRGFLEALRPLAEIYGPAPIPVKDIVDLAEQQHGKIFREDQLRARVVRPLEAGGFIALKGVGVGRGGKSGAVIATEKLLKLDPALLGLEEMVGIPADLRPLLDTPPQTIYGNLRSPDTYTKGIALELLALRMAVAIGLKPVGFRVRGRDTGGAEVDLIALSYSPQMARWHFQCKNTSEVPLSDLLKEVGMTVFTHAHVVVMVTTGRFSDLVADYARRLADVSNYQAFLLNGVDVERFIRTGGGGRTLMETIRQQARAVEPHPQREEASAPAAIPSASAVRPVAATIPSRLRIGPERGRKA